MKFELNQKIFYMQHNRVHSAPVLGRSCVEFKEDINFQDTKIFGDEGVYYQTCHGVYEEEVCFPLGWWMIPTIWTIIIFYLASRYEFKSGGAYAFDIEGLVRYGAATIVSLVAWLIYALAT